jgi:hypothetical protein
MTMDTKERVKELEGSLEMSNGCLGMVRDALAKYVPMDGCPPMSYDDAARNMAAFMFYLGARGEEPSENADALAQQYQEFTWTRTARIAEAVREGRKPRLGDLAGA